MHSSESTGICLAIASSIIFDRYLDNPSSLPRIMTSIKGTRATIGVFSSASFFAL